jgi:2-succinyl-5-enolpyruvyl-6-hydroxy-3-cyclohexene-1-carboxylate synthase
MDAREYEGPRVREYEGGAVSAESSPPSHPPTLTPSRLTSAPNINRFWADLLVEELVRCGVGLFVLAPGSRSAPLASAVAAHPEARYVMHFDERGGAFAALGWARATGRPAAWVTTSGTAVANGLPTVVEASMDGVPLLCLTADRPPELRQTGANQTIDQPGIFGEYVRWRFDLPAPSPEIDPAFVLTTADQAVHRALHPAGPVHLNTMFREPLAPVPDGRVLPDLPPRWRGGDDPFTRYERPHMVATSEVAEIADRLASIERGLVVAGRLRTRAEGEATLRLADALGWPLLPDVGSQIRLGPDHDAVCPYVDLALGSEAFRTAHRPEAVVHLGGRMTSKRLALHIAAASPALYVVVRDDPRRFDPDHAVTHRVEADVAAWCDVVATSVPRRSAGSWRQAWRAASQAVERMLDGALREDEFSADTNLQSAGVHLTAPHGGAGAQRLGGYTAPERTGASAKDPLRLPAAPEATSPRGGVTPSHQEGVAAVPRGKEDAAITEPGVARAVSRRIPEGHGLVLAASMPVRDVDTFAVAGGAPVLVATNRGASGIDGTVATAAGFARGLGRPVTLLIGDLALLHDLNSLALLRDPAQPPVTVVVINNDGGGIFHFLPIARHEAFEPLFGTPHGMGFEGAARQFGLDYARPAEAAAFESAYADAAASGRSSLIEVVTDRVANHALHAELLLVATRAVDAAL